MRMHEAGPGLKILGDPNRKWYGPGYCGICGTSKEVGTSPLIPISVRYWDPDDGWKAGVLCYGCGLEAAERGPQKDDYAYRATDPEQKSTKIDTLFGLGDEDGAYTESQDD